MPNNEHHLRYLKMCDVILKVADKEVNMWNVDDFLSKYLGNSWFSDWSWSCSFTQWACWAWCPWQGVGARRTNLERTAANQNPSFAGIWLLFLFFWYYQLILDILCLQDYLWKRCRLCARRKRPSDTNLRRICGQYHPSRRLRELCRGFVPSRLWNVRRRGRWHKAMQILAICKLDIITSTTYFLSQGPSGNY